MSAAGMEASKPPNSSSEGNDGGEMESRFTYLCKGLALGESLEEEAMALFKESKNILLANMASAGSKSPEEIERCWLASVLYCVAKLSKEQGKEAGERRITLCQILRASKLKVADFFKEMPQFSLRAGHILSGLYDHAWEKRLQVEELKANVLHLSDLSKFYTKAYKDFFLLRSVQHLTVPSSIDYVSDFHYFGWLLFLALRIHELSHFKDLVTCTNALVSILAILILHVPVRFRNFVIHDSSRFVKKSDKGVDLLASLCEIYQTSEDDIKKTMEEINSLIVDILKKTSCVASKRQTENLAHINADGLTYFEGLLDEESLQSSLVILDKNYEDALNIKGEIDERVFATADDSLQGTENLSGVATSTSSTEWNSNSSASPARMTESLLTRSLASPVNSNYVNTSRMTPATPVSTAMTTAKWLRDVISPISSEPSAELEHFLSSCDRGVSTEVKRRANIILEAVFPTSSFEDRCISGSLQGANVIDYSWAKQRKMESLKLYYRVLEAVCKAESQLLKAKNLTSLLSNERFHRCMLACSAELVLATHKTVIMMFPAVLERTGLTAFDLSKVIECFIRNEETLPRELKRHLNSLEEHLLESLAWEKGSSLYNSLIIARPAFAGEINRLGLLAEPMPSLDALAMHHNIPNGGFSTLSSQKRESSPDQNGDARSPKRLCSEYRSVLVECNSFTPPGKECLLNFNSLKAKLLPLQSSFASPRQPNPIEGGETCAETGIKVFFSKVLKLAAIRIRSLSERLELAQQIMERVYCLFQQILYQRTTLFFNRHIDQLILCSFYGVAKVSQLSPTFGEIVNSYKKQPQCKHQIFRSVFVSCPTGNQNARMGQEYVDIITFYNKIFIPSVKPLLMELLTTEVVIEDKNNADGQVPGSPKLSLFPKLPDMSPKKVSRAHNVYVSPLKQSKMDTLLTPGSRSSYACFGESTHAYRSPSSDLTAINVRLNCGSGRRTNASARLTFDFVSDAVVAKTLGYQNGSSTTSAAVATSTSPIKDEKPDS